MLWCPHTFEPSHFWALFPTWAKPRLPSTVARSISPQKGVAL